MKLIDSKEKFRDNRLLKVFNSKRYIHITELNFKRQND